MAEFEFPYRSATGGDFLYDDGPIVEVSISAPVTLISYLRDNQLPRFPAVSGYAVIDTDLADIALNYAPGGSVRARTNLGGDVIMLLGRDLLRRFTVTYDGPNSKVKIAT